MKKLIVALVLSFALIGCSGGDKGSTTTPAPAKTGMSTPAPEASPADMEKTPAAEETPGADG